MAQMNNAKALRQVELDEASALRMQDQNHRFLVYAFCCQINKCLVNSRTKAIALPQRPILKLKDEINQKMHSMKAETMEFVAFNDKTIPVDKEGVSMKRSLMQLFADVNETFTRFFSMSGINHDVIIMAYIYTQRIAAISKNQLILRENNWKQLICSCLIFALKLSNYSRVAINTDWAVWFPSFDLGDYEKLYEPTISKLLQSDEITLVVHPSAISQEYNKLRVISEKLIFLGDPKTVFSAAASSSSSRAPTKVTSEEAVTEKFDLATETWPTEYDDSKTPITNEITINAAPHVIWYFLVNAKYWNEWYPHKETVLKIEGPQNRRCDYLVENSVMHQKIKDVSFESVVTEFEVNKRLAWRAHFHKGLICYLRWTIQQEERGIAAVDVASKRKSSRSINCSSSSVPSCKVTIQLKRTGLLAKMEHMLFGQNGLYGDYIEDLHEDWIHGLKAQAEWAQNMCHPPALPSPSRVVFSKNVDIMVSVSAATEVESTSSSICLAAVASTTTTTTTSEAGSATVAAPSPTIPTTASSEISTGTSTTSEYSTKKSTDTSTNACCDPPSKETKKQSKTLVVFDFDWSLVNENSDTYVIEKLTPHLMDTMIELHKGDFKGQWTSLMNHMVDTMMDSRQEGVTLDRLDKVLTDIPIFEENIRAVNLAVEKGADLAILSDANTHYISVILRHHDLQNKFSKIVTNGSHVDPLTQKLRITPFHTEHTCARCPPNLCKGQVLRAWMSKGTIKRSSSRGGGSTSTNTSKTEVTFHGLVSGEGAKKENNIRKEKEQEEQKQEQEKYERVVYIGDGGGDFCPCLCLGKDDVVLSRKGWTLHKKILSHNISAAAEAADAYATATLTEEEGGSGSETTAAGGGGGGGVQRSVDLRSFDYILKPIKAQVVPWENGADILNAFEKLFP